MHSLSLGMLCNLFFFFGKKEKIKDKGGGKSRVVLEFSFSHIYLHNLTLLSKKLAETSCQATGL